MWCADNEILSTQSINLWKSLDRFYMLYAPLTRMLYLNIDKWLNDVGHVNMGVISITGLRIKEVGTWGCSKTGKTTHSMNYYYY